jgi:uncharacterized protein (TIGR02594 family)
MAGPAWLAKAHEEMGVEEVAGAEANPRIMSYFAAAPNSEWVKDDSTPWCGAFASWLFKDFGLPDEPLRGRAWLEFGEPLSEPVPGCVVVLRRGADPKAGHVALFQQWSKDKAHLYLLGGNQGDRVSIARFKAGDVLGYRWPRGEAVPTGADLANGSRIKREAKELVGVGGATVATGVAGKTLDIPAPPTETLSQFTVWQPFLAQLADFVLFLKTNWMLVAGVAISIAGVRIYRWRTQDAKDGSTWRF